MMNGRPGSGRAEAEAEAEAIGWGGMAATSKTAWALVNGAAVSSASRSCENVESRRYQLCQTEWRVAGSGNYPVGRRHRCPQSRPCRFPASDSSSTDFASRSSYAVLLSAGRAHSFGGGLCLEPAIAAYASAMPGSASAIAARNNAT